MPMNHSQSIDKIGDQKRAISRRSFLKGSAGLLAASVLPISFSSRVLAASNTYSVIEVFLYGGASSAISELDILTNAGISGYSNKTQTARGFWQEAGGDILEDLLDQNRLTQLSIVPLHSSKAHDFSQSYGTLGQAEDIPESISLAATDDGAKAFVGRQQGYFPFDRNLENPYTRDNDTYGDLLNLYNSSGSQIHQEFVSAATKLDQARILKENYETGSGNSYIDDSEIGDKLRSAVALIQSQNKTHYISIPFGGWDMHSNADDQYRRNMRNLLQGIHTASEMIDQSGMPIVIIVRGDFGRNYHYNDSNGWDHGDHQVMMIAGGAGYMSHYGQHFSSTLDNADLSSSRIYSQPTGDYPVLDLSEVRTLQLELMGVSVDDSIAKVADNSFMWSLSFPQQDTPSEYAQTLETRYKVLGLNF